MSKLAQDIVLRPVITEESMQGIALNKYTFQVAKDANKVEIAQARSSTFLPAASKTDTLGICSTPSLRVLDTVGEQDNPVLRAGHCALDRDEVVFHIHLDNV